MIRTGRFKVCRDCGVKQPDDRHHFAERRRRPAEGKRKGKLWRDRQCKTCASAAQRLRYRAMMDDPLLSDYLKARKRAQDRSWMDRNPEKVRERRRRAYHRYVSTPEGRARVNESARMAYRLRAEQGGREVPTRPVKDTATGERKRLIYAHPRLPLWPFMALLHELGPNPEAVARRLGDDRVSARVLWRHFSGESLHVDRAFVERVCLLARVDPSDLYPPQYGYPEVWA